MTTPVTRRRAIFAPLAGIAVLGALPGRLAAKPHITRQHVSAVTDEIGKTESDALAAAKKYNLQLVELRHQPGTQDEFASARDAEIRSAASELTLSRLKVSILHTTKPGPGAIAAAQSFRAEKIRIAAADGAAIEKYLPAIEEARLQLLIPSSAEAIALLSRFPSRALGLDWDPVASPDGWEQAPKGRIANIRVRIGEEAGWRRRFEALDRDGYAGGISLATTLEHSDDALHDLMRLVDGL